MEEKIEVQGTENGEILFTRFGKSISGDSIFEYSPERAGGFNTIDLISEFEKIIMPFASFNDMLNDMSDENAGICAVFDSLYKQAYQNIMVINKVLENVFGEIEFKIFRSSFTNGCSHEPSALVFKPSEILMKSLRPSGKEKGTKP
jgi:hypothetical protein